MYRSIFVIFGLFVALSTLIHLCNSQHGHTQLGGLRLTREYLLALNTPAALDPEYIASFDCPSGLTRDKNRPVCRRGRKARVRQRLRRMKYKPPNPEENSRRGKNCLLVCHVG